MIMALSESKFSNNSFFSAFITKLRGILNMLAINLSNII